MSKQIICQECLVTPEEGGKFSTKQKKVCDDCRPKRNKKQRENYKDPYRSMLKGTDTYPNMDKF